MDFEQIDATDDVKIVIIGVGGCGNNAVNRMIEDEIKGVEYITANTDNQVLRSTLSENKIQLGEKLTGGKGAGNKPEIGKKAAEESYNKIKEAFEGADMVFITAGMGGGTGTGASPIIAKAAKEAGALVVGIVTLPFSFEGGKKARVAKKGLDELKENLDSVIIVPNDKIIEICPPETPVDAALDKGNEVLRKGVKCIVDIIKEEGLINIDFQDVKTVMESGEKGCHICHMGFGNAKGENRAMDAVRLAIKSPLLNTSIDKAENILINITASKETSKMIEFTSISEFIQEAVGDDGETFNSDNVITGWAYSDEMGDDLSIVVIATGINERGISKEINKKLNEAKGKKIGESEEKTSKDSSTSDIYKKNNIQDEIKKAKEELEKIKAENGNKEEEPTIQDIEEVKEKESVGLDIPDFLLK